MVSDRKIVRNPILLLKSSFDSTGHDFDDRAPNKCPTGRLYQQVFLMQIIFQINDF